jgi:acetylornithine deacetylase/succinyl-diaminopimelate desuccinylase-like protein
MPLLLNPKLAGTLLDVLERRDVERGIAMAAMLHNTASPNVTAAGKKVNVIPSRARAEVDGRVLPGRSIESFLAEIQRVVGPDVRLNVIEGWEGTSFDPETPLFRVLSETLTRHHPGCVPVPYMAPGFTDSAAYARLGATCYGFAPTRLPPGMNFAGMFHGHDERIPIDGFTWGLRVLYDVVTEFCGEAA